MRLAGLTVRGFRNLRDATLAVPGSGVVLQGGNGQGKTSLLEAIYFPVLYRSVRAAPDQEIVRFGAEGFHVGLEFSARGRNHSAAATYRVAGHKKVNQLDGTPLRRIADGAGVWTAVAFLPEDDRTLALADRGYLAALSGYRRALAQRNAALRGGRPELARAFDRPLAETGCQVVAGRLAWIAQVESRFGVELAELGESGGSAELGYLGRHELADLAAWSEALAGSAARDQARGTTSVGPHRDDLRLGLGGRSVREFGSTGQQRSAAIALKLLELETLRRAAGEAPALLLDDVFAELDPERQQRLTGRLLGGTESQVFLTSPRNDEGPPSLALPRWRVHGGAVSEGG